MSNTQTIQSRRRYTRNPWVLAAFVLVFGGIGTALLLASHAATPLQPSVRWTSQNGELININSNLCLGTPGTAQAANGTGYVIEGCNGASDEKWSITWGNGTGAVNTIVKNGYGQCLDDTGNSTHAGNPTQAWPCSGAPQQTWTTGYGDGSIRIHGLCLGVSGNAKGGGSIVVIMDCNVPAPTVTITTPASGATLQGTATITATASISGDSVSSIKVVGNGATLKTCANVTSCSTSWSTTSLNNGSYTISATATGALGGSTTTSRSVTVNNPAPSPPPGGGGGGTGGGGGSTGGGGSGSGGGSGGGGSGGGSSTSDTGGISGSFDLGGNSGTFDNSGGSDTINVSGSSTSDSSTIDTFGGSATSDTSGGSGTQQNGTTTNRNGVPHRGTGGTVAAVVSVMFILAAVIVFILWRKRRQADQYAGYTNWAYQEMPPAVQVAPQPRPEPEHIDPRMPAFPREDSGQTAARLNWWLPDTERAKIAAGQVPTQPATPQPTPEDNPPDIFEEGRKRLEEEEWEGRIKH